MSFYMCNYLQLTLRKCLTVVYSKFGLSTVKEPLTICNIYIFTIIEQRSINADTKSCK